jgi:hypothetical protein
MECDHFESVGTDTEATTLMTGNVVVTGTNLRITCDRMEVVSYRKGAKDALVTDKNKFKSMIATGRVSITQGDRKASCGKAVVLPGENKITLTESPMVMDEKYDVTYYGEDLVLLRGERRVLGNKVKIIGAPIKDLGFNKDQKLPAPTTPAAAPAPATSAEPSITVPKVAK